MYLINKTTKLAYSSYAHFSSQSNRISRLKDCVCIDGWNIYVLGLFNNLKEIQRILNFLIEQTS